MRVEDKAWRIKCGDFRSSDKESQEVEKPIRG
jgi:hypothetical protein